MLELHDLILQSADAVAHGFYHHLVQALAVATIAAHAVALVPALAAALAAHAVALVPALAAALASVRRGTLAITTTATGLAVAAIVARRCRHHRI